MAVAPDDEIDARFAHLGEAEIVELCGSLADYGEADGLSRELMLQVGRFAEARYGRDLEVLLAVSRMYLLGGETARGKAALLRAGKLWPKEARVRPLLEHALELSHDPRPAEQAIREAPALPPLLATPQPMPAVRPPRASVPAPRSVSTRPVSTRPVAPADRRAAERQTTPRARLPGASTATSTRPPAEMATPGSGLPVVPRAPGLPRGVEGAMSARASPASLGAARAIASRVARAADAPAARNAALSHVPDEVRDQAQVRTEVSRRVAREAAQPSVSAPDSSPHAISAGGVARTTRIRLLDPEDERRHLDPYELIGEIASGGMATVFLGRLAGAGGFQRFVAIKRLHPHLAREEEFVEMFLDEARIAAGIHNPHVVPILEVGTSDAGYYLVMEFVEGDTLSGLVIRSLQRGATLPPPVALRIVVDALTGLHEAHELQDADGELLGLVHRDSTPQNILVGVDGSARITDFGVARAASRIANTRPHEVKGKVSYLSPEQAHAHEVDRRSDVFTMGIVLWEVLAGRPLFTADTEAVTLSRLLTGAIPSVRSFVPDLPASLDDVCHRALNRDPARRFRTAAEMVEAIERAANAEGSVGIASPRELGRFVESLMGAEIAAQREAVRAWLGQSADGPMSRGARSLAGGATQRPPSGPGSGPTTPKSGVHPAAGDGPPDAAAPAASMARRVDPKATEPPEPIDVTLPAGPMAIAPGAAAKASVGIAAVLQRLRLPPLRIPPTLARLLSRRLSTRAGIALVAVLVLLATAPLALKIRHRRNRARMAAAAASAAAHAPRRTPMTRPAPTVWDDGKWTPPEGGASEGPAAPAEDEPPAEE